MKKKDNEEEGCFVAFVLLSENRWDKNKFLADFEKDWGFELSTESNDDAIVAKVGGMTLCVAIMPAPVPHQEAEHNAAANYLWKGAVDAAKNHQAHLLISVIGREMGTLGKGKLFTKAVSSCLKQQNATAVYTDGAVFEPTFYIDFAEEMKEDPDALPIFDWVWFGIYHTEKLSGIYTYGMKKFGKEEIEVYADADLNDIRGFLYDMVYYILSEDVTLKDGETIGFSEEQKLDITYSKGIALDGKTLKIEYPNE